MYTMNLGILKVGKKDEFREQDERELHQLPNNMKKKGNPLEVPSAVQLNKSDMLCNLQSNRTS
jgi:hypothetical protein